MPRKTKEQNELKDEVKIDKKVSKSSKKELSSASKSKKSTTSKAAKSTKADKELNKKINSTSKKTISDKNKKSTATKKEVTKKSTKTKTNADLKKSAKSKAKKSTALTKSKTTKKIGKSEKVQVVEYYDLPYRYNQTIVKLLAQTPTNLFIYWDISDSDRENYKKIYGDNFFEATKPVLIVYNDTLNYSFEVEINDFANSWYLHVNDSKCEYRIELGRRPIYKNDYKEDYFYVSSSNKIEAPNDRILFDPNQKMIYFKNVKNNNITSKNVSTISFIRNMGKIYNIYDFYKSIYKEDDVSRIYDFLNPSSKI